MWGSHSEDHCEDEVSPFSACIESVPKDARSHVQFMHLLGRQDHFLDHHDPQFRCVSAFCLDWLVGQDQAAGTKRWVSFIEIFV